MKAYSIKKIINKKVTLSGITGRSPIKICSLPISSNMQNCLALFLIQNIFKTMKNREYHLQRHGEHHPQVAIGLFFIVLGLALLVATNDILHLGGIKEYFTWETAMVFIGVLLLLNFRVIGGLLLIAGGSWFMIDHYYGEIPAIIKTIYWPAVIILIGISFIISSLIKRSRKL
jgi:hypothetical protein